MGTDREIRVGLIGSGYIAGTHSAAYRTVGGTYPDLGATPSLHAIADIDRSRAEAVASAWGWERATDDWKTVTRADDIDLVDVCVPNFLHAEIAIDALAHGKHVICEKPLADSLAGAEAMAAAADGSGLVAQVCLYYRLWPAVSWARQLIDSGTLGAVRYFRGRMLQDYAADPRHDLGWRADPRLAGAGALGDLGTHILDIARYLCGDIAGLSASTSQLVDREQATSLEDLATVQLAFEDGFPGVVEASWALRGHKCDLGFEVIGDRGAIRFSWEQSNQLEVLDGDPSDSDNGYRTILIGGGQPDVGHFVAVPGQGMGYRDCFVIGVSRALQGIASESPLADPTFADGLNAARAVDAALRSAKEGAWVRL